MMKKRIVSLALAVPWRVAYSLRGRSSKDREQGDRGSSGYNRSKGRGDRGGSRRKNTFKMGYVG